MEREELIEFVRKHRDEDPLELLLQQHRYPRVDMRQVAQQLEGRKQALAKWPTLAQCEAYLYPPKLNREQSSSEATAQYKSKNFASPLMADLTGGMGIDSLYFSKHCQQVHYVEQDESLCRLTKENFQTLGLRNIQCHNEDSIAWLTQQNRFDTLFIDPARRNNQGHKVCAFEECTPNILQHLTLLRSHCRQLIIKASPMIDLTAALQQLQQTNSLHIVAVDGECKEILFIIDTQKNALPTNHIPIRCVDLDSLGQERHSHLFTAQEEAAAPAEYCSTIGHYLYEPHASLMKGGCHSCLCRWYPVTKLSRNTHLYTSDKYIPDFPGRRFEVLQELVLNKKAIAQTLPDQKAHVASRNYPVTSTDLQKQLGIREGGTLFIIAATMGTKPMGWLCQTIQSQPFPQKADNQPNGKAIQNQT